MFQEFPYKTAPFQTGCGQFKIQFPNGIEVSAINHDHAYCSGRGLRVPRGDRKSIPEYAVYITPNVEVGIFADGDNSKFFEFDEIKGYISPEEYARLLAYVATCPPVKYSGDLKRFGAMFVEAEAVGKRLRDERAARGVTCHGKNA